MKNYINKSKAHYIFRTDYINKQHISLKKNYLPVSCFVC